MSTFTDEKSNERSTAKNESTPYPNYDPKKGVESKSSRFAAMRKALLQHGNKLHSQLAEKNLIAPISPSPPELIQESLDILSEYSAKSSITLNLAIDLGCGDGRWLLAVSEKIGCRGLGYDLDTVLLEKARLSASDKRLQHLCDFYCEDVFKVDIGGVDLLIVYISRDGTEMLRPKLESELKPEAFIISVAVSKMEMYL